MKKLILTKDKFKAIIQVIDCIRFQLLQNKINLKDWPLAVTNAHLFVLDDLSRRMRSKLPMMEDKPGNKVVRYEINAIQALVLVSYDDLVKPSSAGMDPFAYSIFKEISGTIFQKLLS